MHVQQDRVGLHLSRLVRGEHSARYCGDHVEAERGEDFGQGSARLRLVFGEEDTQLGADVVMCHRWLGRGGHGSLFYRCGSYCRDIAMLRVGRLPCGFRVKQLTNLGGDPLLGLCECSDTSRQFDDLLRVIRVCLDEPGGRNDRIQHVSKLVQQSSRDASGCLDPVAPCVVSPRLTACAHGRSPTPGTEGVACSAEVMRRTPRWNVKYTYAHCIRTAGRVSGRHEQRSEQKNEAEEPPPARPPPPPPPPPPPRPGGRPPGGGGRRG